MIPAVIYARFSSHSQTEQSIEGQLAACYNFAEREGYNVIGEYIDRAFSARTDARPDFQRMIVDSEKHTFEIVLVYQLDRFSRNRYDSAINKKKLKRNGVRVVSVRENISNDPAGVLHEAILEGFAEYFSADLSQKIRRGMDMSGSKCLATGGRPALGYKVDETKHYQIDENTAPTVVKIFEMYASGMTVAQIITELNQQNIKTSTGADFNKNSLRKMLTNKRYIGIYTYKGTETPGGIPRIVSDELFNRVAEMMEKNKKAPARARAKEEYLLTTKLFCGHCREMMTGISGTSKTGTIHNYYTCNGRKKKLCSKKNVQKEYIEDRVIALARAQLTDENISKISKAVAALCEREKESSEYRRLERQRRDIEKQKANLVDALKYGKATETLLNEIAKLESGIEGIDRQILMEKAKCLDLKEPEIAFFLTKLRDGDINDITYRRAIIAVMVNAVYLYDDGRLTVIFNSSDRPVEVTEGLLADVEADAAEFVSGVCRSTTREPDEPSVLHQREEPHRFAVRLFPFHLIASLSHEIKQHVDVLTDGAEIVSSAAPASIVPDAAAHLIQELFLPHQNGVSDPFVFLYKGFQLLIFFYDTDVGQVLRESTGIEPIRLRVKVQRRQRVQRLIGVPHIGMSVIFFRRLLEASYPVLGLADRLIVVEQRLSVIAIELVGVRIAVCIVLVLERLDAFRPRGKVKPDAHRLRMGGQSCHDRQGQNARCGRRNKFSSHDKTSFL